MAKNQESDKKKERSRVSCAVFSVIVPGLGQLIRGRVITGILFFLNVLLYFSPVVISHNIGDGIINPAVLIALSVWICAVLDAFLYRSSFLVTALLVSLFCFGAGFFGTYFIFPHLDHI